MTERTKFSREAMERAIDWHVRLTSGEDEERDWHAFADWLETSPEHRSAYDEVEEFSLSLEAPAFSAIGMDDPPNRLDKGPARSPLRSSHLWLASAVAVAAMLILLVTLPSRRTELGYVEYATRLGETHSIRLADGSTADLNSGTKLRITIGETQRRGVLAEGEVLFHVARDARRPFYILFGHESVRVVGTVFDVVHTTQKSSVTVAEGKVRFSDVSDGRTALLGAGDQLVYRPETGMQIRRVNPTAASAWRKGYLVYDKATLADIVEDLNRYFVRKIVIVDAAAGRQRFSGALRVDGERSVVNRLSRLLPIRADYGRTELVLLRSSGNRE